MGYHSAPPPGYDGTLKSSDPQLTTMQPPIAPRYGEQISHSQLTHMPKYEHPSSEHKVEFSSLSSYPQSSSLPPPQYMQMPSQYGQQLHQPQYLQMPPPQQYMQQPMMGFAPQQQYQQPPIQGSSLTGADSSHHHTLAYWSSAFTVQTSHPPRTPPTRVGISS
jgi:hypothetical protein